MAEIWVAEWNTSTDGAVEAGTEYTMVTPRRESLGASYDDASSDVYQRRTNQTGNNTPNAAFQYESFWRTNTPSSPKLAIQMFTTSTDDEGGTVLETLYSGLAVGLFPGIRNAQIPVFTGELTSIRPTPDRPSQWDTYHDPYIFTVPLSGETWRFTCNRDIGAGWVVFALED